jgi:hypothetical protein
MATPFNPVAEIKQAIREARKADQLAEKAAIRTFEVFRALKFGKSNAPPSAIELLDQAHDQLGEARFSLGNMVHKMEKILRQAGYTMPAKD